MALLISRMINRAFARIYTLGLRCLNDYPIRFGSSKPDPSACIVYIHVLPPGNTSKQNRNKYIIEIKNLA